MAPNYDVRQLLGGMGVQKPIWTSVPTRDTAFPRVLPLERGFRCFSSVPVLMLIMPPIKIYIKSYNASGSHASDQSPLVMG